MYLHIMSLHWLSIVHLFLLKEFFQNVQIDILSVGPCGARHTLHCPCHSSLAVGFSDLVCLIAFNFYWTSERATYGVTSLCT